MGYKLNKSIICFDDYTETGVNKIPLYSLVQINKDAENNSRLIIVTDVSSYNENSTVQDLLNNTHTYYGLFTNNLSDSGLNTLSEDNNPELGADLQADYNIIKNNILNNIEYESLYIDNIVNDFQIDFNNGNFQIFELNGYSYIKDVINTVQNEYSEIYCLFLLRNFTLEFGSIVLNNININFNKNVLIKIFSFGDGIWYGEVINSEIDENVLWDVSLTQCTNDEYVLPSDFQTKGIYVDSSGNNLFIMNRTNQRIHKYSMSTSWDITNLNEIQTFDITESTYIDGFFINETGDRLYVIDNNDMKIMQYKFSTPWDLSTIYFLSTSNISFQDDNPNSIWFSNNGTNVYVTDMNNDPDYVYQYKLSVPWDVTTMSYLGQKLMADENFLRDGRFNPDGTILWLIHGNEKAIYEYYLSDPYNLNTATYNTKFIGSCYGSTLAAFYVDQSCENMVLVERDGGPNNDTNCIHKLNLNVSE